MRVGSLWYAAIRFFRVADRFDCPALMNRTTMLRNRAFRDFGLVGSGNIVPWRVAAV
jgi:hypothetical protein